MAQFKRFSGSESQNYNSSYVGAEGELTWDPDNGLRIHDGNQNGGQPIGIRSYQNLQDLPTNLATIQSSSSTNDKQFLRYNKDSYQIEYADDFRVVPFDSISYPDGVVGDKPGDIAFTADAIYYCHDEPNYIGPAILGSGDGYSNGAWVVLTSIPDAGPVQVNQRLSDGNTTLTVVEIVEGWPGATGSRMIVRMESDVAWHAGMSGTELDVITSGEAAYVDNWVKFSAVPPVAVNEGSEIRDYGAEAGSDPSTGDITIENTTYKRHWLLNINGNPVGNRRYVLGNGSEGDVIYFMPGSGFKPEENLLSVSNYEYYDGDTGHYAFKTGVVQLFGTTANSMETIVKATWSYGAWHFSGPVTKIS